jgi:flagellar protein FlgJ
MNPLERLSVGATERSNGVTPAAEAKLRKTALQLEGLFVQRMFAAMRETVPQDGIMAQSSAESTFSSLLDEKMAEQAPTQWSGAHSLAEALYRQLRARIEPAAAEGSAPPQNTVSPPSSDPE